MAIYISGPRRDRLTPEDVEYFIKSKLADDVINPDKIFSPLIGTRTSQDNILIMRRLLAAECKTIVLLPRWEKSYICCQELQSYLHGQHKTPIDVQQYIDGPNFRGTFKALAVDQEAIEKLKETCRKRIRRHFNKLKS